MSYFFLDEEGEMIYVCFFYLDEREESFFVCFFFEDGVKRDVFFFLKEEKSRIFVIIIF